MQFAFCKTFTVGYPFLYTRHAIRCRNKTRTHRFFGVLQQIHQYIVLLPVGYDDGNTLIRHFAGNGRLGQHASPAETRFLHPDIVGQVFPLLHLSDDPGTGSRRRAVINTVDIAQDNQRLHVHHGSNHARKLIIVGKHQFRHRNGIIFVYNRNDSVFQHHHHAVALVEIMTTRGKTLLCGEHLPHGNVILTKEFIITVYQFRLSHSRKKLPLVNTVQLLGRFDFTPSRSDCPRRD